MSSVRSLHIHWVLVLQPGVLQVSTSERISQLADGAQVTARRAELHELCQVP